MAPPVSRLSFDGAHHLPLHEDTQAAWRRAALTAGNPASVHQAGQDARRMVERAAAETRRWCGAAVRDAVLWLGSAFEAQLMVAVGLLARDKTEAGSGDQVLWVCAETQDTGNLTTAARALGVHLHLVPFAEAKMGQVPELDAQGRPWARVLVEAAGSGCGAILPVGGRDRFNALLRRRPWALVLGTAAPLWPVMRSLWPEPDALVLEAGPIGAPSGASSLVLARGSTVKPLSFGGGQQDGLRPGTVAKELACGLAAALHNLPAPRQYQTLAQSRDALDAWARDVFGASVCGCGERGSDRLPHVTLWHLSEGDQALLALQQSAWQSRLALSLRRGLCGRLGLHIGLHPGHSKADVLRLQATLLGLCKAGTTCARENL